MDPARENARVERLEIAERDGVTALPGAPRMVATLSQDRFAVVTSATRALALARLGYAGLPSPQNLICADDVVHGKPSPEPYLKGASLLGVPPEDCLVFEDTPTGIEAARGAGMPVIGLLTTYPAEQLAGALVLVESLERIRVASDGSQTIITILSA
jgi:sugar-phosphatase